MRYIVIVDLYDDDGTKIGSLTGAPGGEIHSRIDSVTGNDLIEIGRLAENMKDFINTRPPSSPQTFAELAAMMSEENAQAYKRPEDRERFCKDSSDVDNGDILI